MEFLKDVLGEELYNQVAEKINDHNEVDGNKSNQIKLGNLGKGEYVAKGKYAIAVDQLASKSKELQSANDLIEKLKEGTVDNEKLSETIADYEARTEQLQQELAETQLKSAIKIALLSENAVDVDYLTYKLNQSDEELMLGDDGKIKGWSEMISSLKNNYPSMFASAEGGADGFKPIGNGGLPKSGDEGGLSKEELMKMTYSQRAELYETDPDAFKSAMNDERN